MSSGWPIIRHQSRVGDMLSLSQIRHLSAFSRVFRGGGPRGRGRAMGFSVSKSMESRPFPLFLRFGFGIPVAEGSDVAAGMRCFSNGSNDARTAKVTPAGRWWNRTAPAKVRGIASSPTFENSRRASETAGRIRCNSLELHRLHNVRNGRRDTSKRHHERATWLRRIKIHFR